jgi:hypothetical protein
VLFVHNCLAYPQLNTYADERRQEYEDQASKRREDDKAGPSSRANRARTKQPVSKDIDELAEDRAPYHRWSGFLRTVCELKQVISLLMLSRKSVREVIPATGNSLQQQKMGDQMMQKPHCETWPGQDINLAPGHTMA